MTKRYWLFKSEPDEFSIDDFEKSPQQTTGWDGVRNFEVRNLLRDEIEVGDQVLFYHSSSAPMAVVGAATVIRAGYPDPTQFEARSKHFDPSADRRDPRWYQVDIQLRRSFTRPITLAVLKKTPGLEKMTLLQRGNRHSVLPVTAEEWKIVCKLASAGAPTGAR